MKSPDRGQGRSNLPQCQQSCEIKGEGDIAGVDNGNSVSHEYFQASKRKAIHGLYLVVMQTMEKSGKISLEVPADDLKRIGMTIETNTNASHNWK